jgi:YfiH family protein
MNRKKARSFPFCLRAFVVPYEPMLTSDALSALDGIRHGFFTREGGVSSGVFASLNVGFGSGDAHDAVVENRRRAEAALGFPGGSLVTVHQHHSAEVALAAAPWGHGNAPQTDAMVCHTPGVLLGVLTADCAPVLFADAGNGVIGAAHAGWKGAKAGVLEATLEAMAGLGADRAATVAAVGPCIAQASYEVGDEFFYDFLGDSAENERFFAPAARENHHLFDLAGYVEARLAAAGVRTVEVLGADTYGDDARFFSYRRACHAGEADYGRLLSAIGIEGEG